MTRTEREYQPASVWILSVRVVLPCLILMVLAKPATAHVNETIPPYHWLYRVADQLAARGYFPELRRNSGPWTRGELARALVTTERLVSSGALSPSESESWMLGRMREELQSEVERMAPGGPDSPLVRLRGYFEERVSVTNGGGPTSRLLGVADAAAEFGRRIFIVASGHLDQNLLDDPKYQGKKWRGFAGYGERCYIALAFPYSDLKLGRDFAWWGVARKGNLILSDDSRPFDLIQLSGRLGPVTGIALLAALDPLRLRGQTADSLRSNLARRYLAGHRISIHTARFELGASETVLMGGPDRIPDADLINPLLWFYESEINNPEDAPRDNNLFFGFDARVRLARKLELHGELLIDDLGIEEIGREEVYALNTWGAVLGLHWADLPRIEGSDLTLEYARVANWTYNHRREWNRYLHRGRKIGHPLGNDGDRASLELAQWLRPDLWLEIGYQHSRQGEGGVDAEYTEPWVSDPDYSEPFPSGVVQRSNRFSLVTEYHPLPGFYLEASLHYDSIHNFGHRSGEMRTDFGGSIRISCWLDRSMEVTSKE